APDPLRQVAGGEVGQRFRGAEGDDEGENGGAGAQAEVVLPDQRQHAPLQTDHGADERVQANQQCELAGVGAQAEPDRRAHAGVLTPPLRLAATICSCSAGGGGMSATSASANAAGSANASSGLKARSKPIEETG